MTDHHFMSTRVSTKPVSNAVHAGYDGAAKRDDGIPLYGMDKELADKAAAKFDPKMEREAREWIEAVTGEALEGTLQEALKSGVVLCALVNALKPGVCKKPSTMKMAFQQMENIAKYLEACSALGVPKHDLFQTVSLYENQDMMAVITNIHSLGRVSGKVPGYSGPTLGAKLADKSVRHFDDETLRKGRAEQTFLGKGSHGHASQAGTVDTSRNIGKMDKVRGIDGLGTDASVTAVGMGSHGHASQAGTFDTSKNISKVDHVKGIDGLGTDGILQINLGSHGHATQEGMGKMHGTREIVHQTFGGAAAAAA